MMRRRCGLAKATSIASSWSPSLGFVFVFTCQQYLRMQGSQGLFLVLINVLVPALLLALKRYPLPAMFAGAAHRTRSPAASERRRSWVPNGG